MCLPAHEHVHCQWAACPPFPEPWSVPHVTPKANLTSLCLHRPEPHCDCDTTHMHTDMCTQVTRV